MFTRRFWTDTAERVLSTMAETALAFYGTELGIGDIQWSWISGATLTAGALTVLKALAATRVGDPASASFDR